MDAMAWDRRCLLLTNHAMVLAVISSDPSVRIREIAEKVEITERAVESLIADLTKVGFLSRRKSGRRNVYRVHEDANLRHPLVAETTVGGLMGALAPDPADAKPEVVFGELPNTEEILSCAETVVAPILSSETHSTKEGTTVKKVLLYMVVASVLLCASVAVAATTREHHIERPAPPQTHHKAPSSAHAAPAVSRTIASIPSTAGKVETHTSTKPHTRRTTHRTTTQTAQTTDTTTTTPSTPGGTTGTTQTSPSSGSGSTSGTTSVTVGKSGATVKVGPTGTGVSIGTGSGGVSIGIQPTGTSNPITINVGPGLPILGN